MIVHHAQFDLQSDARVAFHDVTDHVREAVAASGVSKGLATVYSQHTTCSVMLQEESHDVTAEGTKFLMQDLVDLFDRLIPPCRRTGQYLHPGPAHLAHATGALGEHGSWSFNTDAHLRSCLLGRSETIPVIDNRLELDDFGQVYFVDFDTVQPRPRVLHVQVMGVA